MKPEKQTLATVPPGRPQTGSELLLLPDGRLLVHNLTRAMAELLRHFDPGNRTLRERAEKGGARREPVPVPPAKACPHELSK